ncbi:AAA-ATPase [Dichanthelium oligosanthes]|uniref:AAA-ATPase n=1 Tax=Dichanthelium oligosanthes TaxID=888268 RepID=A0A1E5UTB4_9POAL|nr:AAA-ATPase [Dichanthelium oligosanthes]
MMAMEGTRRRERALQIFMNEHYSCEGINHQHRATFDTVAMDPALKQSIIADLDRFVKRREYYRRIGKAWKRGYLQYGPPGTAAQAKAAHRHGAMPNKSTLVIEDIDCCFKAKSREGTKVRTKNGYVDSVSDDCSDELPPETNRNMGITLSGLLNFIDGPWSTSGEERIIVFTTNYKDRLDPALLRPGRMDIHVYMGYCCWEALKTLVRNYFVIDGHELFPEVQELLSAVEVTPAEVTDAAAKRGCRRCAPGVRGVPPGQEEAGETQIQEVVRLHQEQMLMPLSVFCYLS